MSDEMLFFYNSMCICIIVELHIGYSDSIIGIVGVLPVYFRIVYNRKAIICNTNIY